MTKLSLIAVSLAVAFMLAANVGCMRCGEKAAQRLVNKNLEQAVNKATGGKAQIDVGGNVDLSGLPAEFRYPNAAAKGRWSMTNEKGTGTVYAFESADPVKTVADFYKTAISGWKQVSTMESDNATVMGASSPDGKQSATVTVGSGDGKTTISVLFTTK